MPNLSGKHILLGITGGVAAYKAAELLRLLVKEGATVEVAMSEAATHFVGAATFQALSGRPVWLDAWDAREPRGMAHIDLTRRADLMLVTPATADFMAKAAAGLADDLLSTLVLARPARCPLAVAPAMNREMWEKPAVRRNAAQLAADGVLLWGPAAGEQACGEEGVGRMLEPAELCARVVAHFQPKALAGRRVLITAGPTFEALDPVRGLTNLSSGKMGFALARAAAEAGAAVTLVAGPVAQPTPLGVARIDVGSALDMREAVMARLAETDIFIAVAAVADYRPADPAEQKIKKSAERMTLDLVRNPDILAEVAALPDPPFCVGFAAETEKLDVYAEGKRQAKRLPLLVGNLAQDGFGGEDNTVVLYDDAGRHVLPTAGKLDVARAILGHVARMLKCDTPDE